MQLSNQYTYTEVYKERVATFIIVKLEKGVRETFRASISRSSKQFKTLLLDLVFTGKVLRSNGKIRK